MINRIIVFLILFLICVSLYALKDNTDYEDNADYEPNKGIYAVFNEGLTSLWLTRIMYQKERSNFVFRDFFPGLYLETELCNLNYLTPMIRLAAYYPLNFFAPGTSTFNKVPQNAKLPLHYGLDFLTGVKLKILGFKYIRFNIGPAFHLFLLTSDRWVYLNLGAAVFMGVELPISSGWTVLLKGSVSLDNGNLGANYPMEKFDMVYQYQLDIGVRYSKKLKNKTYITAN
jgi:hypothetical protein